MKNMIKLLLLLLALVLPAQSWAALSHSVTNTYVSANFPGVSSLPMAAVNVTAGTLLVVCVKSNTVGLTSIAGTGSETFTMLTAQTHTGSNPFARCGYYLSTAGNASYVVTLTMGSSSPSYVRAVLYSFSYTGTASFDVEVGSTEDTADLTPSSNSITPLSSGSDGVCVALHADNNNQTFTASSETINGVAGSGVSQLGSDTDIFYRILTGTFTGVSTLTRSAQPVNWIQRVSCFKTDAGGGGGAVPRGLTMVGAG